MQPNYFISIAGSANANHGTIHDPRTKLKVKVIDLVKSKFRPKKGEIQYFVTTGKQKLAFETSGYKSHKNLLILQMIAMYCMYLGLFEARIQSGWPI